MKEKKEGWIILVNQGCLVTKVNVLKFIHDIPLEGNLLFNKRFTENCAK